MLALSEMALALFLIADLALAGASRLKYAIRLVVVEVEAMVEDADAQIGHADLIGIGEGEGEPRLDRGLILDDLPILTARITAGTGDGGQKHAFFVLIHDESEFLTVIFSNGEYRPPRA